MGNSTEASRNGNSTPNFIQGHLEVSRDEMSLLHLHPTTVSLWGWWDVGTFPRFLLELLDKHGRVSPEGADLKVFKPDFQVPKSAL